LQTPIGCPRKDNLLPSDTLVVPISDLQSGGTTALFPDRFWQFEHCNHTPTDEQKRMFVHWLDCASKIKAARKWKRVIVVHNGDAIDGVHHGSLQTITYLKNEQKEIHVELMETFLKAIGGADELYYVKGTPVHVDDIENDIANDLSSEKSEKLHAFDELKLEINGKRFWFTHKGPQRGKGHNRGNSIRNWLKALFYDLTAENIELPHYIISSHFHDPDWGDYIGRHNGRYHKMELLITPSWQQKTRYGYDVAPFTLNKIGLSYLTVAKGGEISDPVEWIMK